MRFLINKKKQRLKHTNPGGITALIDVKHGCTVTGLIFYIYSFTADIQSIITDQGVFIYKVFKP